ncbi:TetR family transcriptional regulator [Streptomyces mayteni]
MATDEGQHLGLRGRRRRATRRALSEAAPRLAVERGLDKVLVEDVAAVVGVSPRTFNNYFSNEQEAVVGLALVRAVGLRDQGAAQPAGMPLRDVLAKTAAAHVPDPAMSSRWRLGARLISETALEAERPKTHEAIESSLVEELALRTGRDLTEDLHPGLAACVGRGAHRRRALPASPARSARRVRKSKAA